jgi:hypothetical protein
MGGKEHVNKTMVIVRLLGGLGNQMFQYAAAKKLALANKTDLVLDTDDYRIDKLRIFRLGSFNIQAKIAVQSDLDFFYRYRGRRPMARLLNLFQVVRSPAERVYIKERHPGYDDGLRALGNNVYLEGYWQSEKYFAEIGDAIRQDFTLKAALSPAADEIMKKIGHNNAISIHIRRGDYLTEKLQKVFSLCSLEYYEEAIRIMKEKVALPNFFVFSDDVDWARNNLRADVPLEFVSQAGLEDCEEMILMSRCKHHIIANSSFSWWGAWLNPDPAKIVIAPQKWYSDPAHANPDLIPNSWLKI